MRRLALLAAVVALGLCFDDVLAQRRHRERAPAAERQDDDSDHRDQGRRGNRRRPNPLMVALDTDKDGELSATEIENAADALMTLDQDGDGKLSASELRPPRARRGPGGPRGAGLTERIMSQDSDGDGTVTADEMPERMRGLLERADTNGDGAISEEEAKALEQEMGKRGWGRSRRGPDERDSDKDE